MSAAPSNLGSMTSTTPSALPTATILGYPRIGRRRELKRAVESFWKGGIDEAELQRTAAELRAATRARLVELGLSAEGGAVPESFSFYDQVLDATLALGAIPAFYALIVRWGLPESPRWLARRGRLAEADQVVARFEANALGAPAPVTPPPSLRPAVSAASAEREEAAMPSSARRLAGLWTREFRVRTAALWVVWFCVNFAYYGAFIWIPSILFAQGYDLVKSFGFTLVITLAQLPGYAVAAWLIEVWGRRPTLSALLAGATVSAVLFGTAAGEGAIIGAGMALSFFTLGAWGALYAVTPENYPASMRAPGAGWAAGVGRSASIIAPLTVPGLLALGGTPLLFTVFAVFFLVAAGAVWGLADPRGAALDER